MSMTVAGVSIAKDLAIVVAAEIYTNRGRVGNPLPPDAEFKAVQIYSHSDGRAFRGCPYWKYWISKSEIYTHDTAEEIDFGRVISDFCQQHAVERVGYSPEQIPKVVSKTYGPELIAVTKDSTVIGSLDGQEFSTTDLSMLFLNQKATRFKGFLFEANSCMQYMWASLPHDGSDELLVRALPTKQFPATGRYDGVRALLNALAVSDLPRAFLEEAYEPLREARQQKFSKSLWEHPWVWVSHRFQGVVKLRPQQAANLLGTQPQWTTFICYGKDEETTCPQPIPER